jgi:hypothetical protein
MKKIVPMNQIFTYYDNEFTQFYQKQPHFQAMDLPARITAAATYFLGQPYVFEPLGEGETGYYSKLPLYRTDQFDCVTFVDTVLALAKAATLTQFKQNILRIRYAQARIDYTQRTDWFTDLEWNPHMQQLGYTQDVTTHPLDQNKKPIAQLAHTIIDKPAWYAQKTKIHLNLPQASTDEMQQRLTQLKAEGKNFMPQSSTLSYIPLTYLFITPTQPNPALWNQLPDLAVIQLVRPHWRPVDPKDKSKDYGTHLNVAHLGIAIRTPAGIIFYHAAARGNVMHLLLVDYLRAFLSDTRADPVQGIHIEEII